jgi:hypothetical protein
MKYLKKFNEGIDKWYFYLEQGEKYTLYNFFDDGPLPIEILEIDDNTNTIEFECLYSYGNKHEWEENFIGTEMEGLVYDPYDSEFNTDDIEKIDGDKIYLKK